VAVYFIDSSALVRRYVIETGTAFVTDITDPGASHHMYVARITGVEVIAALARRGRGGDVSADALAAALDQLRREFATQYRIVEMTSALLSDAMRLAETRALRGYDAVQLAAALRVNTECVALGLSSTLVSADGDLNTAARAEGLSVEDPNAHP
jgi:predicted nucleic acid-binding protein